MKKIKLLALGMIFFRMSFTQSYVRPLLPEDSVILDSSGHAATFIKDEDYFCSSCDEHMPQTTLADCYILYTSKVDSMKVFGQFQKIKKTHAFETALTIEEIDEFIKVYGSDYLRTGYSNYFLCMKERKLLAPKYFLICVDRDGNKLLKDIDKELIHSKPDLTFINIFLKKVSI
jgi:hypothetical protein